MLAARFYGAKDIRSEEVDIPTIKASDDVLVEIAYCGICGTDLHEYLVGPIVTPMSAPPDGRNAPADAGPRVLREGGGDRLRRA